MRKLKWKTWKTHQFLGVLPLFKINSKFLVGLRLLWWHGLPPLHRPALRNRHQPGGPQCGVYAQRPATPRRPLATWPVPAGPGDAGNWSAMAANEGDGHGRHLPGGEKKGKTQDTERKKKVLKSWAKIGDCMDALVQWKMTPNERILFWMSILSVSGSMMIFQKTFV